MEKHRIVWVDDDKDDLEVFREILKELQTNGKLVEFHNGKDVLNYLDTLADKDFPCLIILDMNMPVLDGRQTLSAIKSQDRYNQIPVVIFTTSDSVLDKAFCRKYQTEMFTKPPSYPHLKEIVAHFLSICSHGKNKML